jgi:hypothetical protein
MSMPNLCFTVGNSNQSHGLVFSPINQVYIHFQNIKIKKGITLKNFEINN